MFVHENANALYGHCDAPPRTDVIIRVDSWNGDYDMCVKPGVTRLGKFSPVINAVYTGNLCDAG